MRFLGIGRDRMAAAKTPQKRNAEIERFLI
jgi:hypothetical protein